MEIIVDFSTGKGYYYIRILGKYRDFINEDTIAEILGLSLEQYHSILLDHNAREYEPHFIFYTQRDCMNAVNALEPYIIMTNLL